MAVVKISELPTLAIAADDDILVINDVSEAVEANKTKKITVFNLLDAVLTVALAALKIEKRQGGSTSDWTTNGTTNYTPSSAFIQSGVIRVSIPSSGFQSYVDVTLPQTYTKKPLVFVNYIYYSASAGYLLSAWGYSISTSAIRIYAGVGNTTAVDLDIAWMTIGE